MKNLFTVLKYTFLEVYRSKLLVGIILLALGLVVLSYVASEFAYGASGKVTLDVGLGILSLSNLGIAIFIGSTLLVKEIEQKTLYMILSRPISRASFLIGKILGLSSVLLLNTLFLGAIAILLYLHKDGQLSSLFFWSLFFTFLESFIVLLFSVFFSLITNTTLSVIYTIVVFVVGHALNETSKILFTKINPIISNVVDFAQVVLPNFYKLNIKDFLIYEQNLSLSYLFGVQAYGFLYAFALMIVIVAVFNNKNLD